jgi:alkanesulfonate monooxygenase SsuD/methylene tetrahydromethanopterin reductase-like flavin-dependent oxidoreductase (luciferase family)
MAAADHPTDAPGVPFAPGSISVRLYPHNELDARGVVSELCGQAALALDGGFDGVMTSEHHGAFAGYLPGPLQFAGFVLESSPRGWAAACPLLLPLRPVAQVAEEVAWLAARHPGRVGLGVAAGALPLDFEVMGVPVEEALPRFVAGLPRIVDLLAGRSLGPLSGDRALQACAADPVPVLSAAASPGAARRAAACGAGVLTEGMSSVDRLRRIVDAYRSAGGGGPAVVIRRVWLGAVRRELVAGQRAVYDGYAGGRFGDDQTVADDTPDGLADRLVAVAEASGASALNLRVHLPGLTPADVRDQLAGLAGEVLPRVRARWRPGGGPVMAP